MKSSPPTNTNIASTGFDEGFRQEAPRLSNTFTNDTSLQLFLKRHFSETTAKELFPSLERVGALAAGELHELSHTHRNDDPQHISFDAWGNRVDDVELNPAWSRFFEVAAEEGLIAEAYERGHGDCSRLLQFAKVYLLDRSMQVSTCPMAMTDGAARSLQAFVGVENMKNGKENLHKQCGEVFSHLISRNSREFWTSGQWMTETIGGSDVGLSETRAVPDKKQKGMWRLYGTKWFTSAVTAEVALALARPEGNAEGGKGLALFLVRVRDDKGVLQNIRIRRLKEKLGTRHLPTAELELDGTEAIPIADLKNGVFNMRYMLNITRTWNAVVAVAHSARGLALARSYAQERVAFGATLAQKPLHVTTLADVSAEHEAGFHLVFHMVQQLGKSEAREGESPTLSDKELRLLNLIHPLAKLMTGKQAVAITSEVLECIGGSGYVEDTGLPELFRDAQVLPIWEGTTNVLSLEVLRALRRDESLPLWAEAIDELCTACTDSALSPALKAAQSAKIHTLEWVEMAMQKNNTHTLEQGARRLALTLARTLALALLAEQAQWVSDDHTEPTQGQRLIMAANRFARNGVDKLEQIESDDMTEETLLALGCTDASVLNK